MMSRAFELHRKGDLDSAEALYRQMLAESPDAPAGLHCLGVLLHQRGQAAAALDLLKKSIELAPDNASWCNDLGNALTEQGHLHEAAEAFLAAIRIEPNDANLWNNLGSVFQRQDLPDSAVTAYQRAILLKPDFASALQNYAQVLAVLGRESEAADYYCRAFVLPPYDGKSKKMLGIANYKLGRIATAAEIYLLWLAEDPGNPEAAHLLAACTGHNVPARASDAYVEALFKAFADHFDSKLIDALGYSGPDLIEKALSWMARPGQNLRALDAGCGTGLVGLKIRPYLGHLTGVDLSLPMLDHAKQTGVYDELFHGELFQYLASRHQAFDLVTLADTLIYFGPLESLFSAAAGALNSRGLLIFTVEEDELFPAGFSLSPSGRYLHGRDYLPGPLDAAGLDLLTLEPVVLRLEWGAPVYGLVVTARMP